MAMEKSSLVAVLAHALVQAALANQPTRSVTGLCQMCGVSRRVFQRRCHCIGVTSLDCVRFVQCLKLTIAVTEHWDPPAMLPALDERTIHKILKSANFTNGTRPAPARYVQTQMFLNRDDLKQAIAEELALHAARYEAREPQKRDVGRTFAGRCPFCSGTLPPYQKKEADRDV